MEIYDITQPVFSCAVFPGDPVPQKNEIRSMENGDLYNLTAFSMCAHNGTHTDAPLHFYREGKSIDELPLEKFIGPAYVAEHNGEVTAPDAKAILARAEKAAAGARERILIKGKATVTLEAAEFFAGAGISLIGNESQTVGPEDAPMAVHLALLGAEIVLLEGIRLSAVPEGAYLLNCAPLQLSGAEGAPCRAVLIELPLSADER